MLFDAGSPERRTTKTDSSAIARASLWNREHRDRHNATCRKYNAAHPDRTKKARMSSRAKKPEHYKALHRRVENALRTRRPEDIMVRGARLRSQQKGLPFDLHLHVKEIGDRLRKGVCELSGLPFQRGKGVRCYNSPSIDRIIPKHGYVYNNIRIVLWAINSACGDWGAEVTLRVMRAWVAKEGSRNEA